MPDEFIRFRFALSAPEGATAAKAPQPLLSGQISADELRRAWPGIDDAEPSEIFQRLEGSIIFAAANMLRDGGGQLEEPVTILADDLEAILHRSYPAPSVSALSPTWTVPPPPPSTPVPTSLLRRLADRIRWPGAGHRPT